MYYIPHNRVLKYMKQKLTEFKIEVNSSTIVAGDFSDTQ